MAGYQQTLIIGNVGRDPYMRYTQSGVAVCDFSVAVTRRWTDSAGARQEQTTWFRVSAWRALAETCNEYVRKGMRIMVAGEVGASAYTAQDGKPRASLELTARDVLFLSSRADAGEEEAEDDEQFPF